MVTIDPSHGLRESNKGLELSDCYSVASSRLVGIILSQADVGFTQILSALSRQPRLIKSSVSYVSLELILRELRFDCFLLLAVQPYDVCSDLLIHKGFALISNHEK